MISTTLSTRAQGPSVVPATAHGAAWVTGLSRLAEDRERSSASQGVDAALDALPYLRVLALDLGVIVHALWVGVSPGRVMLLGDEA
jgi:hypothetical protein